MFSLALPSTKDEILQHLLKQDRISAQELADRLGISPQAVRRHLKDLAESGLIYHQVDSEGGMGRPQYLYSLSAKGRSLFPQGYSEFSVKLLQSLTKAVGQEPVQALLHQQWQEKANHYRTLIGHLPLPQRLEQLASLRRSEGYVTEWFPQPDREGFFYTEYNCVIAEVANSFPNVCSHELAMFKAIFPEFKVDRIHWMIKGEHFCGYVIGV
jgi:DeoR family suf operon transcriptional repressor